LHFTVWSRQSKRRRNRNSSSRILLLVILLTSCHSIYSLTHALCLFVLICYVILCLLRYVTLTYHHRQIYLLKNDIKLLCDESKLYCEFILRYIMNLNQCIIISILVHKIRWMFNDRHKKTLKTCYIFVYFDNNSFKHYIVSCQFEMIGKSIKLSRKRKYIIIIWNPTHKKLEYSNRENILWDRGRNKKNIENVNALYWLYKIYLSSCCSWARFWWCIDCERHTFLISINTYVYMFTWVYIE